MHLELQNIKDGELISKDKVIQHNEEGEMDFSESLLVMYSEPEPLQVVSNAQEEDIAANASEWVQANMIKLGQQFGIDFKGCSKEAYALLSKLNQRRDNEIGQGEGKKVSKAINTIPKEVRNLIFDVNFKDGEPRSSGRILAITNQ